MAGWGLIPIPWTLRSALALESATIPRGGAQGDVGALAESSFCKVPDVVSPLEVGSTLSVTAADTIEDLEGTTTVVELNLLVGGIDLVFSEGGRFIGAGITPQAHLGAGVGGHVRETFVGNSSEMMRQWFGRFEYLHATGKSGNSGSTLSVVWQQHTAEGSGNASPNRASQTHSGQTRESGTIDRLRNSVRKKSRRANKYDSRTADEKHEAKHHTQSFRQLQDPTR